MNFRVYKSSAGSGKTFTLVLEYLALVIKMPQEYRSILAVTFTNKAANEMKDRILKRLKELASGSESSDVAVILPRLIQQTGLNEAEIRKNAAEVLTFILHRYSDFAVCTIDSFTHRIIRSFAHDLHLPQNFDVEMNPEKLIAEAVDMLISKAGIEDALTKALVEFTEIKAQEEKNWNIENDLAVFAKALLDEDTQQYISRLKHMRVADFIKIKNKIAVLRKTFEKNISTQGEAGLKLVSDAGLSAEYFYRGKTGIVKYFEYLRDCRSDKLEPNSYVYETIEEDKWYSAKAGNTEKAAIDGIKDGIRAVYTAARTLIDAGLDNYIVYSEINRNIFPLAVLNETALLLDSIKEENNIIFISEFNQRISDVVLKEPVPFIYERAGERFKNFLLDEFQDTSVMQWQNLLPLIDNSLSNGQFNLVVGDGKQAIYRWRNGEVEQFERLPEVIKKRGVLADDYEESLSRNYEAVMLDTNFRSLSTIIEFNNDFFTFIREHLDGAAQNIYAHVAQKALPSKKGGYVELQFISKTEDDDTDFAARQFDAVETIIAGAVAEKYAYKDITIICRSNNNASATARYLIGCGIPVISSESLLLSASPDINFILSVLRWFSNTHDDLSKAAVLAWLVQNGHCGKRTLNELLGKLKDGLGFNVLLRSLGFEVPFSRLLKEPVYELCEEIIRIFKLSAKADPYLAFFLDAVFEYAGKYNSSLSGFLEWWEDNSGSRSVKVPEGTDAVRVMTIHKAKGLEFPIVIYAFATEKSKNTKAAAWVELKDETFEELPVAMLPLSARIEQTRFAPLMAEEREKSYLDFINLLYVVLTRPIDRLFVLTDMPTKKPETLKCVPDLLSSFLGSRGAWNEEQHVYTFGEKAINTRAEKPATAAAFTDFVSTGWKGRVTLKLRAPEPSDEERNRQVHGQTFHRILSEVSTFDDIESAVAKAFAEGLMNADEKDGMQQYLQRIADNPAISAFFVPGLKIKTECEIIDSTGKSFRPDRIVLFENQTAVIDFKTGSQQESHTLQLQNYASLLAEMGYRNIDKYLLYLHDEPLLVKV
ncbi:MAG: UvrD-helicase domain-containing protein [Bacteroidota bacterium]